MAEPGPDDEILEFAIAREVRANRFYLALASRVENPEMRKTFEDLAEEELEHKAKLELEVMKRGKVVAATQKTADLKIADDMTDDESLLDMTYKDMLILAIQKEDAAFRFYVNMAGRAKDQDSHEMLLSLAEEEVKHKLRFEIEYDLLLKEN